VSKSGGNNAPFFDVHIRERCGCDDHRREFLTECARPGERPVDHRASVFAVVLDRWELVAAVRVHVAVCVVVAASLAERF
jgi:hypothetical protein